jgi:hypothetical protein
MLVVKILVFSIDFFLPSLSEYPPPTSSYGIPMMDVMSFAIFTCMVLMSCVSSSFWTGSSLEFLGRV